MDKAVEFPRVRERAQMTVCKQSGQEDHTESELPQFLE